MRYTQREPSNLVISSHTLITGDAIVDIASCTLQERELCRVCVCVFVFALPPKLPLRFSLALDIPLIPT